MQNKVNAISGLFYKFSELFIYHLYEQRDFINNL